MKRRQCPHPRKDGGPCGGHVQLTPDPDGEYRCRAHSLDTDLVKERRERRKKEQRVGRRKRAAHAHGQVTAAELAALEAALPADTPAQVAGQPEDVAAWIYGQEPGSPAEDWPAVDDHPTIIEVRRRVVVAVARAWLSDSEAKVIHQHLTGIKQSLPPPREGKADQRGSQIVFRTVRSREDVARLEIEDELGGEA